MAASATYTTILGQIVHEVRSAVERFYVPDPLGNTAALVDASGAVTDTWTYWPYGEVENHTGVSATPFTFVGTLGYYAETIGRITAPYVRARFMRPDLARWMEVDSEWPFELAYGYVLAPTTYSDRSGRGPHLGIQGGGFGPCAIYVCYENTGPISSIPGHEEICVTGPNGGCSGGLYPNGNPFFSPGTVVTDAFPCKPGWQTVGHGPSSFSVKCVKQSSSCLAAAEACACIKAAKADPPNYTVSFNNCYSFANAILDCVSIAYNQVIADPIGGGPFGGGGRW